MRLRALFEKLALPPSHFEALSLRALFCWHLTEQYLPVEPFDGIETIPQPPQVIEFLGTYWFSHPELH
jgi:hypothetical protein